MRKQLLVVLLLCGCFSAYAQLSGVITIDNSLPASATNYVSFNAAITDLNNMGVGPGGVIFQVAAGQTFSEPELTLRATGTTADPIVFIKNGAGSNPKIMPFVAGTRVATGVGATGDYIFRIAGSDHVTIDGIDLQTSGAFGTDSAKMEYGYYITKMDAGNASQNVVIVRCNVDLNSNPVMWLSYATGIYVSNHDTTGVDLTVTADGGRHENIRITRNVISNSYNGIMARGFNHNSAPYQYYDHSITIDSNIISTYGGPVDCYAIYMEYNDSNTITGNTINIFTQGNGTLYGVHNGTSKAATSNILGNVITLTSPMSAAWVYSIFNAAGAQGSGNTINIGQNEIHATANSQYVAIQNDGSPDVINIYGNTINNIIDMGPSGSSAYGVWSGPSNNNTVTNIYDNAISGVYLVNGGNVSTVFGLICQNGGQATNVFRNRVFDIMQNGGGQAIGIRNNAPNCSLYNNYVYDVRAMGTADADAVKGIDLNANGPVTMIHNTVVLNTLLTMPGIFGSSALYVRSDVTAEISNNILVNLSMPGSAGGYTAAYKRDNTNLNTHLNVSNNNCFYAGMGTHNVLFYDNTDADTTIQALRLRFGSGREALSFSELPPFASVSGFFNLTLSTSAPTQCESAGKPTAITADFYSNSRNVSTPDVGAEEGTFVANDLSGPVISYTPIANTTSISGPTIAGVEITDASGVNVAPGTGTAPRLYFKPTWETNEFISNSNWVGGWKYVETSGSTSPFTFTIDYSLLSTPVAVTDTIQYFFAAQDLSANNNISTYMALSGNLAPVALDSIGYPVFGPISAYRILPGLSGTYTVGTGATYTNLNNVVTAIEQSVITDDVVFELQSTYAGGEIFPVVFSNNISKDDPSYTITIRPAAGVSAITTEGDPGASVLPLIDLNGSTHLIFDGRAGGAGSAIVWKIRNTRNTFPSSVGPVFRFTNGAQYDTLRYLQVEGESTSGDGLVFFGTTTGAANTFNTVANCKIRNRTDVTAEYSASVSSSGTPAFPNASNTIINNELFNFVNNGINVGPGSGSQWTITGNHLYNNHSTPPASAQRAILFAAGAGSYANIISGNYIGGSAPMCGGLPWTNTGNTANFRAIAVDCDSAQVSFNTIRNFAWTGTSGNAWTGILIDNSVQGADVEFNHIGDSLLNDTIRVMGTNATIGISTAAPGTVNIRNNGIHMLYANRAATNVSAKGILNSGNDATVTIANNSISHLYTTSTRVNLTTTADFAINGILSSSSGTVTIQRNHVRKLSVLTPGTTVVATAGIACSRSAGAVIESNRIYDLNMNATGDSNRIFGIAVFEAPASVLIANNMITVGNNQSSNVYGIGHEGNASAVDQTGPVEVVHNSVVINGTVSAGTASNSYGFYSRFSTPTVVKNNILSNQRTGGAGSHFAIAQLSATPSVSWSSNYNMLWASNSSTLGAWGNPAITSNFTGWQTNSTGDAQSQSQSVAFTNIATGDLHLAAVWYGNMLLKGIAIPAVTLDFDGETRFIYPYMGADEVVSHPLPVKLLSFTARKNGTQALLNWSTASEINCNRFEIERSTDAVVFEKAGVVKAGRSTGARYEYKDITAPFTSAHTIYYRLRIVDNDGSFGYSDIAALSSLPERNVISVYPNPFSDKAYVNINAEAAGEANIAVFDIAGKPVTDHSYSITPGVNALDIAGEIQLPEGVYFVTITHGAYVQTVKLVKY